MMNTAMPQTKETEPVSLPARLRQARDAAGLTRKHVASSTGIPFKSLEKIENGTMELTLSRAKALSNYYGIPIGEMLSELEGEDMEAGASDAPSDLATIRRQLHDIAERLNMDADVFERGTQPPRQPRVAMTEREDGDGEMPSAENIIRELADFVETTAVNERGVRRRVLEARKSLSEADLSELVEIAANQGWLEGEELEEMEALVKDEEAGRPNEERLDDAHLELRDRILVFALYELDLKELNESGIRALANRVRPRKARRLDAKKMSENDDQFKGRVVAQLASWTLRAVEQQVAPDLADRKHFPREDGDTSGAGQRGRKSRRARGRR